jgi:hypothetical protein
MLPVLYRREKTVALVFTYVLHGLVESLDLDRNVMRQCDIRYERDQTPLKDVLDCLSKHYGVSFAATDLSKKLSGEFYTDDLNLIIELIESALDVTIIKK